MAIHVATNGRDEWFGILPEPNEAGTDGPLTTWTRKSSATLLIGH